MQKAKALLATLLLVLMMLLPAITPAWAGSSEQEPTRDDTPDCATDWCSYWNNWDRITCDALFYNMNEANMYAGGSQQGCRQLYLDAPCGTSLVTGCIVQVVPSTCQITCSASRFGTFDNLHDYIEEWIEEYGGPDNE